MRDINEELHKVIQHGQILIEEKAHMILGIKEEMRKTSEHFSKVTELKDMGKREAELHYKEQYNEKNKQFEKEIGNIREQYEHLIE